MLLGDDAGGGFRTYRRRQFYYVSDHRVRVSVFHLRGEFYYRHKHTCYLARLSIN